MSEIIRPPTLKDVAQRASLSSAAVSLILNGKGTFRPETRELVLQSALDLGYRPNGFAQAIANGRFGSFALLLASEMGRSLLPSALIDGIEDALELGDKHLSIARLPDEKLTDEGFVPKILSRLMADGLLINYQVDIPQRMHALIEAAAVPAVWLNRKLPLNAVHPDDFGDAVAATRHLLSFGHRRIGWLDFNVGATGTSFHYSNADRYAGYCSAMQSAGLAPRWLGAQDKLVRFADRVACVRDLLRAPDRPTAIITYNSDGVVPVMLAATAEGLAYPRDLSLICFAGMALTSLGQDITAMVTGFRALGHEAVTMLRAQLLNRGGVPTRAVPGRLLSPTNSVAPLLVR